MQTIVETDWLLAEASVKGKAHVDNNLPNQDSVALATSTDGQIIAAVVSDGAGTAPKAEIGSRTATDLMIPCLLEIGRQIQAQHLHPSMVRDRLSEGILTLRRTLDPTGTALRDYHCTLVGCLITPSGGFVCQIGDSIAVTSRFSLMGGVQDGTVDFFPDDGCRRYEPERGEYSNETHFITEQDWGQHLRVSPLPDDFDAIVLMTDGAMDVITLRNRIFRGFMSNLFGKLLTIEDRSQRSRLINDWLADKQTYAVTGDDKTLFVAIRAKSKMLAGRRVFIDSPQPEAPATPQAQAPTSPTQINKIPGAVSSNATGMRNAPVATSTATVAAATSSRPSRSHFWLAIALGVAASLLGSGATAWWFLHTAKTARNPTAQESPAHEPASRQTTSKAEPTVSPSERIEVPSPAQTANDTLSPPVPTAKAPEPKSPPSVVPAVLPASADPIPETKPAAATPRKTGVRVANKDTKAKDSKKSSKVSVPETVTQSAPELKTGSPE